MFIVRRLLFAVVALVALAIGASVVLEGVAESQLATGLRSALGLRTRPTVEVDAFPILLRVVQGRIPRVFVGARDVVIDGFEIAELTVELRDVHASLDVLTRSNRFDLKVDHGEGVARVAEASINRELERRKSRARATLRTDGTVFVRADSVVGGRTRRFEAAGTVVLQGRTLTFRPTRVTMDGRPPPPELADRARKEATFSIEIPELPAGIVPTRVVVTQGELDLVAELEGYTLDLG